MKLPNHFLLHSAGKRFKRFWQTVKNSHSLDNRFIWIALAGSLVLLKVVNLYFQQIHVDIAWNLYIAGQILDGARLHVDLIETNTPLRHYLGIPPVWLARTLGWPVLLTFYGYVLLLAGLSLALCRHILNKMFISMPVWWRRTLLLMLVYVYIIYVGEQFGQKEHLMLILAMPYLFAAGRALGQSLKGWAAFFIGGLAGIGFCIKPFFLLVWLMVEVYLFLTLRRQYPYRRPENIGLGLVVLGYTTFLLLDGAYLALVPLLQQTYAQIKIDFSDLVYNQVYTSFSAVQLTIAALIAMMIVPLTTKQDKALGHVVLISAVGVLVIAFYQQKGWPNHFYPAAAAALLLLSLWVLRLTALIGKVLPQKIVFVFMILFLLQGLHPLAAKADRILATLEAGQPLAQTVTLDPPIAKLVDLVNAHTDKGDYIVQFPGFYLIPPIINYTQTRWSLRYAHPWLLEAAYWEQRDKFFADRSVEPFPYHSAEEMDAVEREFVNNVMADLLAHRPKLILVNASWSFDAIEYFSRDARFVELWSNYVLLDQVAYGSLPFGRVILMQVYQYLPPEDFVPVFKQKLRLVNPTDKPYVYAYIWNNDQTETYLLDDSSRRDKEYKIEWMISPNEIEFEGPHKRHDSSITTLSSDQPLAIAVVFSDSPERTTQNIFERRFRFKLTDDGRMGVLLPPEEWHNPSWPDESTWQITDINQVMTDR